MKIYKTLFTSYIVITFLFVCSCKTANNLTSIKNLKIEETYKKTLIERTQKIVAPLNIEKKNIANKVQNILINQYVIINDTHKKFDDQIANLKANKTENNNQLIDQLKNDKQLALENNKEVFVNALAKYINSNQIEQVKDGMTYGVVPKTWAAYLDMLPNLTQTQKDTMYAWLIEARELAISESTSDKKHAMFGKFKGKINNFLSKQGYDMKKESKDWEERIKQKANNKTSNNS